MSHMCSRNFSQEQSGYSRCGCVTEASRVGGLGPDWLECSSGNSFVQSIDWLILHYLTDFLSDRLIVRLIPLEWKIFFALYSLNSMKFCICHIFFQSDDSHFNTAAGPFPQKDTHGRDTARETTISFDSKRVAASEVIPERKYLHILPFSGRFKCVIRP